MEGYICPSYRLGGRDCLSVIKVFARWHAQRAFPFDDLWPLVFCLQILMVQPAAPSEWEQWTQGLDCEMWYKSTAWPPQHSTPLNIQRFGGRVGSARVNLSQCRVILLWLPGACVRAKTHKQFYQAAHGVLGKGICSGSFFYNRFLIFWYVDDRFIGLYQQEETSPSSGSVRTA